MFAVVFLMLFALSTYTLVAVRGKKMLYDLLGASVLGATVVSLCIMLSPDGIGTWFAQARGGATIGNSSVAATYILFNIFFALILIVTSKKTQAKVWWSAALVTLGLSPLFVNWHVLMGAVPYTGLTSLIGSARGAVLGILFGIIVTLCTWLALQQITVRKYSGIAMLLVVFGGIVFGGVQLLTPTTAIHQRFVDSASSMRFIFWDIAWQGFTERPVLGWGPGTFDTVYHALYRPEMLLQLNGGETWVDRTHNLFVETMVTGGALLTLALLFFLISIVGAIVREVRRTTLTPLEASILLGMLAGWLLQAQFVFESILSFAMVYMVAGMVYATALKKEQTGTAIFTVSKTNKYIFTGLTAVAVVVFVYTIAVPYKKDQMMINTYNAKLPARASLWQNIAGISPMGDGYDSVLMFNKMSTAYNAAADSLKKEDPLLHQAALDELDAVSERLFTIAQSRKNDYGIHIIGAQMYYYRMKIADDFSGVPLQRALVLSKRAVELSPTDPQAYWVSAQLEMMRHNFLEAKNLLEQALALEPRLVVTHNFILQLAFNMKDVGYYNSSYERAQQYIPGFTINK